MSAIATHVPFDDGRKDHAFVPRTVTRARTLELVDAGSPRVEEVWRALEASASPSYFLTWAWIDNWLACLPRDERPRLAVVLEAERPVAAFFLGRRWVFEHGVLRRVLSFNATGIERRDELCLEHNRALAAPGVKLTLAELIALLPPEWDELLLPAIDEGAFELTAPSDVRVRVEHSCAAPFVDLGRVRDAGYDYIGLLGAATRAQLRRARRDAGALGVEIAEDVRHAFDIYDELVMLHQRHWRSRGKPGAFADPWFDRVHRRLIAARLAHGEIQLLRVRARGETLGCLYNLVAGGRVLSYQSGVADSADPRAKPAYLCHAEAVVASARAGHAVYDLLGGDGRFKRQLATGEERLLYLRVQRPLARFVIEDLARNAYRALRSTVRRRSAAEVTGNQ